MQISYSPESIKIKQNKNGTFYHTLHHRSEKGTEVMKITLLLNVHILYRIYVAHWQTNTFSNKKALPIVTTGNQMKVLGGGCAWKGGKYANCTNVGCQFHDSLVFQDKNKVMKMWNELSWFNRIQRQAYRTMVMKLTVL